MINIYCLTDKSPRLPFWPDRRNKTDYLAKEDFNHSRDIRFVIKLEIYSLTL